LVFALIIFFNYTILYPIPAFPGAEGYGAQTIGGRGGTVIKVVNLNADGPGSFRKAVETSGPRIIVFDVGGVIELPYSSYINASEPFCTIAGQTAPGDGITIKGGFLRVTTHDVIVRGIRCRPGDEYSHSLPDFDGPDAFTISSYGQDPASVYNVIYDHCSSSWAVDENLSLWRGVNNITIQWCITSEGLDCAGIHTEGGEIQCHSMGMLVGGGYSENVSFHHNVFAHNVNRNPLIHGAVKGEFINNIVYNWRHEASHLSGDAQFSGIASQFDLIGNYYKPGVNTRTAKDAPNEYFKGITIDNIDYINTGSLFFVQANIGPGRESGTGDEWLIAEGERGYFHTSVNETLRSLNRLMTDSTVTILNTYDGYNKVLTHAGVSFNRDIVDERIISDIQNGTGTKINNVIDVGGYPYYAPGTPPVDSDSDGMPDSWENDNELDPNNYNDNNDIAPSGYTWIEEYVNSLIPQIDQQPTPALPPTDIPTATPTSPPPDNLVLNPGFEDGAVDWGYITRTEASIVSSPVKTGSAALKLELDLVKYINVFQYVPVTTGEEYNIQLWIKAENITSGQARLFAQWYSDLATEGGSKVGDNINEGQIVGNTEYKKVVKTASAPSGAQYLRLYLSLVRGIGAAYFDDVSVMSSEVPVVTSTPTPTDDTDPVCTAPPCPTGWSLIPGGSDYPCGVCASPTPTVPTPTPEPTATPTSAPIPSNNLVINPGFESGAVDWGYITRAEASIVSSPVRSGNKALKLELNAKYVNVYQYVPVTAGEEYTIELWIKAENITSGSARLFAEWYSDLHSDGGSRISKINEGIISENTAYMNVSKTETAPSGAQYLRLYLSLIPGSGNAYFDDVSVMSSEVPIATSTSTPTPIPSDNLVINPGFESGAVDWGYITRAEASIVSSPVRSGNKALKLELNAKYVNVYQYVPVTAGEEYTIKLWIKAENITSGSARLFAEWYNDLHSEGGSRISKINEGIISGNTAYMNVSKTETAPSGAQYLRLYLSLIPGTGSAYFDDVSVKQNAAAVSIFRPYVKENSTEQMNIKKIYNMSVDNSVDLRPLLKGMEISPDNIISVSIYDIRGRVIRKISAGREIKWDFNDIRGNKVESGVYIYSINIKSGENSIIRKGNIIIIK
ncbi:hypothetical protein ACFL6D_04615, partial [Spirochaetota bacterium]